MLPERPLVPSSTSCAQLFGDSRTGDGDHVAFWLSITTTVTPLLPRLPVCHTRVTYAYDIQVCPCNSLRIHVCHTRMTYAYVIHVCTCNTHIRYMHDSLSTRRGCGRTVNPGCISLIDYDSILTHNTAVKIRQ